MRAVGLKARRLRMGRRSMMLVVEYVSRSAYPMVRLCTDRCRYTPWSSEPPAYACGCSLAQRYQRTWLHWRLVVLRTLRQTRRRGRHRSQTSLLPSVTSRRTSGTRASLRTLISADRGRGRTGCTASSMVVRASARTTSRPMLRRSTPRTGSGRDGGSSALRERNE